MKRFIVLLSVLFGLATTASFAGSAQTSLDRQTATSCLTKAKTSAKKPAKKKHHKSGKKPAAKKTVKA